MPKLFKYSSKIKTNKQTKSKSMKLWEIDWNSNQMCWFEYCFFSNRWSQPAALHFTRVSTIPVQNLYKEVKETRIEKYTNGFIRHPNHSQQMEQNNYFSCQYSCRRIDNVDGTGKIDFDHVRNVHNMSINLFNWNKLNDFWFTGSSWFPIYCLFCIHFLTSTIDKIVHCRSTFVFVHLSELWL